LWCVHREFSYELIGERILKIGPHLPKSLSNISGYVFETQYSMTLHTHTHRFNLPPNNGEVCVFARTSAFVCLSVSKITQNACVDLDEILRVDRGLDMDELINF